MTFRFITGKLVLRRFIPVIFIAQELGIKIHHSAKPTARATRNHNQCGIELLKTHVVDELNSEAWDIPCQYVPKFINKC